MVQDLFAFANWLRFMPSAGFAFYAPHHRSLPMHAIYRLHSVGSTFFFYENEIFVRHNIIADSLSRVFAISLII